MVNEIAMSHGLPLGQLSNPVVSLLWSNESLDLQGLLDVSNRAQLVLKNAGLRQQLLGIEYGRMTG